MTPWQGAEKDGLIGSIQRQLPVVMPTPVR